MKEHLPNITIAVFALIIYITIWKVRYVEGHQAGYEEAMAVAQAASQLWTEQQVSPTVRPGPESDGESKPFPIPTAKGRN